MVKGKIDLTWINRDPAIRLKLKTGKYEEEIIFSLQTTFIGQGPIIRHLSREEIRQRAEQGDIPTIKFVEGEFGMYWKRDDDLAYRIVELMKLLK